MKIKNLKKRWGGGGAPSNHIMSADVQRALCNFAVNNQLFQAERK